MTVPVVIKTKISCFNLSQDMRTIRTTVGCVSDFMVCQKQRRHCGLYTQVSHNSALDYKFPAGEKLWRLMADCLKHGNTFPTK